MKQIPACLYGAQTMPAIAAFLVVGFLAGLAVDAAEPMSTRSIIDRLKPSSGSGTRGVPRMRGISIVPPKATVTPSDPSPERPADGQIAKPLPEIARPLVPPSIHFAINFALNSTEFDANAVKVLGELGEALRHRELQPYSFEIAGHTDAAGSAGYNLRLSERRAHAVRRYLTNTFGIRVKRLRAIGFGESHLLDSANPLSGANRRVQITNLGRR
jgi:outer membrane protein OmpA-like peptidoglycan-associated protein